MDKVASGPDRRFCVAPMMRYSHGPARRLWRELCPDGMVYTEMVIAGAVVHGDPARLLEFDPKERPLGLQLGGNDPGALRFCARLAELSRYDEINLNVGCPSGRVSQGEFGACMMRRPELVADCVRAMKDACSLPVTVKTRIAVDELDPVSGLDRLATKLAEAGTDAVIVHARRAWTKGLNPKENRTVPPLDYGRVRKLKRDFPELEVILNGGIRTVSEINGHLAQVDGVMCGREVARNPLLLAEVSREVFGRAGEIGRKEAIRRALELAAEYPGRKWRQAASAMLGLCRGAPNGRAFRRALGEVGSAPEALRALESLGFA